MGNLAQGIDALAMLPTDERLKALQRVLPRSQVDEVLAETGHDKDFCKRLPGWFMVWFVVGIGLFCKGSYRQIYRWLQVFQPGGVPGRSTLCEARKRLGSRPLLALIRLIVFMIAMASSSGSSNTHTPTRLCRTRERNIAYSLLCLTRNSILQRRWSVFTTSAGKRKYPRNILDASFIVSDPSPTRTMLRPMPLRI